MRGDDHPRSLRRIGELRLDDRRERQVAERPATVPALVATLGDLDLGPGGRVEIRQRREPIGSREPVTGFSPPLSVEKVVGERLCVIGGKAERPQLGGNVVQKAASLRRAQVPVTWPRDCS